jgi:DNA polymerase-3 subunit delta'
VARRWPRRYDRRVTFRAILGHQRVKTLLSGAISRGTLPPTLLFAGPSGIGKAVVAKATAAAINCLSPVVDANGLPLDACGACRSCDRIARGVHVDVMWLEPDDMTSIKIDVVRDMLERTGFRPFEGRRRVVIVREADALEPQAQNALLKSLEEPPPGTVFILTTGVPGVLLPTVRSRCMQLRFGRLTETEVATLLQRDHEFSAGDARVASALADGSVGQAMAYASADLATVRELGMQLLQQAARSTPVASRLQAAARIVGPPKNERTRQEVSLILRLLASLLRDIELLKAGGDSGSLANAAVTEELDTLTRAFPGDRARDAFGTVDRAIAALGRNRNAGTKVVAEWVATQI